MVFFCEHIPSYVGRGCIIFSQLFFTKNIIYAIKVACQLIFRISPCRGLCTLNMQKVFITNTQTAIFCKMDAVLSEILIFKLFRAEAATGTVTTPAIVIALNVIKYHRTHIIATDQTLTVDALYLQRVEKAFRAGIVIAAAFCTHAAPKVVLLQQGLIIC